MSFNYYLISLKMALMHVFTEKFIAQLDADEQNTPLDESFDDFVLRHIYAFVQMRNITEAQATAIEQAILEAKEESKLHVLIVGSVVEEGMGRHMDQIVVLTQFWEDHFAV